MKTGHVGLNVTDLDRSIAFYRDVFQLTVLRESHEGPRRFAFLGEGDTLVLTLWEQSQGTADNEKPGLHHLSFQVDSRAEIEHAEQRLRALSAHIYYGGIVPHAEGAHSGGIFFSDPDGTRLEIYAPAGMESEQAPVAGAPT
ncbi:VOC family protein [bacterium]|nr:MAG: VOC family protein [bacterium]